MLTRIAAYAAALIVCAMTFALSPGTALAGCHTEPDGTIVCDANDGNQQPGSGNNSGGSGNGGNNSTGNGCQNQGNGLPGQGCTPNPPAPVVQVPSIDLAWQARGALPLPAPHIHWSPQPRSYVQLRTGLWVDQADFGLFDKSVTAGGQTVTAHATPKRVEWNLVENTIQCANAGTSDGTSCGYTYQRSSANQPGGRYQISATIVWGVTWDCAGACVPPGAGGTLDDIPMTSTAQLPVDEIQTESQPG